MRRIIAVLAVVTMLLTACSSTLPTQPVPQPGLSVDVQSTPDVRYFLQSPQPGASATQVVQGFLRANIGFATEDDVAREFLTPELASQWVPTQNVVVVSGTPQVEATGDAEVTVSSGAVSGYIDAEGRLVERTGEVSGVFSLTRVDGEWRIDGFPEQFGLWLSVTDLQRAFGSTTIYYLNPHLDYFVPETRWFPLGDGIATAVARTQLAPVPGYLEGAVRTGASPDVRLAVGAVPVDPSTQVATVNLEGEGLAEDLPRILDLRAQLGHALLGLSGVKAVELRQSGRNLLPDDEGAVHAGTDLGYTEATRRVELALLRVGEGFTVVDPTYSSLPNLPTSSASDVELPRLGQEWTGVAATEDLDELAAVSDDGRALWRWREGRESVNRAIGDELTAPSYDPHGALWTAGVARSDEEPRVWVVESRDLNAVARPVEIPWITARERIDAFRVSPDGARSLLVVRNPDTGRQRLYVCGIVRDSDGRPTGLAEPLDVAPTLVDLDSARWASTREIVVTGQRVVDAQPVPYSVPIGGWLDGLGDQAGLVDVLAVPTGSGYMPIVQTSDGRFHTREGTSRWFGARNGDELIIPGT